MDGVAYLGEKGEDGRFKPDSPKAFSFAMAGFKVKQRVRVTFEEYKETRTNRQSRAWWGIVIKSFCDEFGYRFANKRDREFVHTQVLFLCGWYEVKLGLHGEEIKVQKPTHNLPKDQFKQLYETAQEEGAKLSVMIADPESPQAMGAKA